MDSNTTKEGEGALDVPFSNKGSTQNLQCLKIDIPKQFLKDESVVEREVIIKSPLKNRSIRNLIDDAKSQPPPKMMCGGLIYENELVVLFAKTGIGKSIFATQIAFAVARGDDLDLGNGVVLRNDIGKKTTVYLDFELSDTQNLKRIQNEPLPSNLYYTKVRRGDILEGTPKDIFKIIKDDADSVGARFIIIDNISKISSDLEKAENAKIFLNELWVLCRDFNYTILIITHTPKVNKNNPITEDSIAGSSKIGQLVDGIIGMNWVDDGEGKSVYIKQIKTRNGEKQFGINNVICTNIKESETGFVRHYCYNTISEHEALNSSNKSYNEQLETVLRYNKTGSLRGVADEIGINHSSVKKRIDKFKENNFNEFIEIGEMSNDDISNLLEGFD